MDEEMNKAVSLETAVEMFRAYKESDKLERSGLVWDDEAGAYANDSIVAWMDAAADGLVYGVQIPKFAHSQTTEAVKTDANAGLVLEGSTNAKAGRNDYEGRKLFWCTRVNGGVDLDGMPYVTAIEGMDSRFDCTAANTWALTPVYYIKRGETDEYYLNQYTDTPQEGFEPCFGAYTDEHVARPFILRACYMDSAYEFSSMSGTVPASSTAEGVEGYNGRVQTPNNVYADNVTRGSVDGLTRLTAGDVAWQLEFMQLMLGVKAPKVAARGCLDLEARTTTTTDSEAGYIIVDKTFADKLPLGCCLSLGTIPADGSYQIASRYSKGAFVVVEAIQDIDGANTKISISGDVGAISAGVGVGTLWWRNGSCDQVLGTFGAPYESGLTDNRAPFRFQNCEFGLGLEEIISNVHFRSGTAAIASSIPKGSGDIEWVVPGISGGCYGIPTIRTSYTADYRYSRFYCAPFNAGASSTTGFCAMLYSESGGYNPYITGGSFASSADYAGVGFVRAYPRMGQQFGAMVGSRLSAIGRSEVVWNG